MKYEIIQNTDLTFNVEGRSINIVHCHFKSGDYEGLINVTKTVETINDKPYYTYEWGDMWLDHSEYCRKDIDMEDIIEECIAYVLCEDHDLYWIHP